MLPMGGTKGAMLALVVELLVTALTGAAMGFEASSFFVDEGNRPRIGQAFLVIDPDALAGRDTYLARDRNADRGNGEGSRRAPAGRAPPRARRQRRRRAASRFRRRSSRSCSGLPDDVAMTTIASRPVALLLNVAHALDHMFLLIFATAVGGDRGRFRLRRTGNR